MDGLASWQLKTRQAKVMRNLDANAPASLSPTRFVMLARY